MSLFLLRGLQNEATSSPALCHNMSYVAAQAMFYLVAGTYRIQLLNEMEPAHTCYGAQEASLRRRIGELENDVCGF